MPVINRQKPPVPPRAKMPALNGEVDILSSGVPVSKLGDGYINVGIYGRNGSGKTTLACFLPKPLALIAIDPAPMGGARSVRKQDGVVLYQVAGFPLVDPTTGKEELVWGSQKILAIAESLQKRYKRGERPFESVVIDGVTSWGEVLIQEVLGVPRNDMPAILGFGKISQDQYTERAERMIRYTRAFIDMPCNLGIIGQEKDHNPPKDEKGRVIGNKLIRPSQERSWFSFDAGAAATTWIQNACDFVVQLYEDDEYKEDVQHIPVGPGKVETVSSMVPTGRRVRRMRTSYHANYAGRSRNDDYRTVPEYITTETPEQRWEAFMCVVRGERTKYGKYHDAPPTV